jgi:uncharacterized alpha-E superfamily protein
LIAARQSVHAISGTPAGMFRNPVEQLMGELCSELDYAQVDDIVATGLHEYLDRLQTRLNHVGADIHETFFARPRLVMPVRKGARARKSKSRTVV